MKIDLVLSGGSSKFPIHIGVLKALEELNIEIRYIWGTSAGALVGGLYKSNLRIDELEKIAFDIDISDYASFSWFSMLQSIYRGYLADGDDIVKDLEKFTQGRLLKNVPGFKAIVTDISTDNYIILHYKTYPNMPLSLAIRASISIPYVFKAVEWEDKIFIDGGVRKNFPMDVATEYDGGVPIVGALIKSNVKTFLDPPEFWEWPGLTFAHMMDANLKESIDDLLHMCTPEGEEAIVYSIIEIDGLGIDTFDFKITKKQKNQLITNGYNTTKDYLKNINADYRTT